MAERTPLFMDIADVYSGDELGLPYRHIVAEGVDVAGDLAVTAGAGNSIDVAAGTAFVLGDTDPTFQPCYLIVNDAVVNKGINPDPANPRKVLVIAQMIDEGFVGTGRKWEVQALHGDPNAVPVEPALPNSALELALVDVPAAAASSAAYTITDRRKRAFGLAMSGGATEGQVPVWDNAAGRWKAGSGSDIVEIYDATLGADAASVDITGIPSTYAHLMLVVYGRTTQATVESTLLLRFNGDTAGNYRHQRLEASGTSVAGAQTDAATSIQLGHVPGASATADFFGGGVAQILHYAGSADFKSLFSDTYNAATRSANGGLWKSIAAINQITVLPGGGNLLAGTRVTLYGLKAVA